MDIWKILGIAPTTDKKSIRKAYAAKTREIHPEEKPEEFRQLHEAYQAALGYAALASNAKRSEDTYESSYELADEYFILMREEEAVHADETTGESGTSHTSETVGEAELISYFGEQQEKHQQSVDAFLKYWETFQSPHHNSEVMNWWKEYLASEAFRDIRYHPQVLHLLAEEIDRKFFYGIDEDEVKLLFWDAYGFREEEGNAYQGEQQRLWDRLYPAYARQQKKIRDAQSQMKYERALRIIPVVAIAALVVVCIVSLVDLHVIRENGRRYLIDYMAEQYQNTEFSEPERLEKLSDGNAVYSLHPSAHPELQITAKVEYQFVEGKKFYLVTEDYCQLLLGYYAAQYGLASGQVTYTEGTPLNPNISEYSALFYPDIESIDIFCENVERMFCEQEALKAVSEAAICTESVLFPKILFQGGVERFPFVDMQVYDLGTMRAEELSAALREAYMIYMFQYESWNITTAQYREWGAAYEKICEKWEDDNGEWHEVYDPDTGEYLCRLFVPTYEQYNRYYDNIPVPNRMITVGNAYYFLIDRGADLTVMEDGSGFSVEFYGDITNFGEEPEENFYELQHCY